MHREQNPKNVELLPGHKKLLGYISKKTNALSNDFYDLDNSPKNMFKSIPLTDYVKYLHNQDLIYVDGHSSEINGNYIYDFNRVKINKNGVEYFKWQHEFFKQFLYRSVIIPISVAVLTSLITTSLILFIKNILGK